MHALDLAILYFFNQTLASLALDALAHILTTVRYWFPVYVIGGIYVIYRFRWRGVWMVLAVVLVVAVTDSLGHYILKPLVHRERPCAELPDGSHVVSWIRLPDGGRGDESFPSNHALNNFAVAAFFTSVWPRKRVVAWLFVLALLISLGRVYQGLHYPSDVVGGAVIGVLCGYGIGQLYNRTIRAAPLSR